MQTKWQKSLMLGASFLEIMFVLGLMAAFSVLGFRYYLSSKAGAETSSVYSQMLAIAGTANQLSEGSSNYVNNVSTAGLAPMLKERGMTSPWNTAIEVIDVQNNSFTVKIPGMPATVCAKLKARVAANPKIDASQTGCPQQGKVDFIYTQLR